MIKQLEGLMLCSLWMKFEQSLFRAVFETFTVTPDDFLEDLVVKYSDRQQEKMAETTVFQHFCDLVKHPGHNGSQF